jgi:hypothetical protein
VFLDLLSDSTLVCGGVQQPAYKWIKGEQIPTNEQYVELATTARAMQPLPTAPFNVIDKKSFFVEISNSRLST